MARLCMVSVLYCGQIVTGIVSGHVNNVNSWILNIHLQFSAAVPVSGVVVPGEVGTLNLCPLFLLKRPVQQRINALYYKQ